MSTELSPHQTRLLREDERTQQRLELNFRRNKKQDHTEQLDRAARDFDYAACRDAYWNPESHSLLFGTPLWTGASAQQKVLLNQLYWVAYYAQIISAEIATIYYNQTSAAGLYALEDFRLVCDTLDLESTQERAHIAAFRKVSEAVEQALFGERIFTYPMRGPFDETMVFADSGPFRRAWKSFQLRTYSLLSSGNAYIACQYFTVRGLRTLNGKQIQHALSQFFEQFADRSQAPLPSAISGYHFQDESYHFNSSLLISQDVVRSLRRPTPFEQTVVNTAIRGCQQDHKHFSAAINGIFWHEPAVFPAIYKVLRSQHFGFDHRGALEMLRQCFTEENEGIALSCRTHQSAIANYEKYLETIDHLWPDNRTMRIMKTASLGGYLAENRQALARFEAPPSASKGLYS